MAVGGGLVRVVLPGVSTVARKPQGERQGRGDSWRCGAGVLSRWGLAPGGVMEGIPVVPSGIAIAAAHAHFVHSWVPKDRHSVGAAEGCGPQVAALVLRGAGNHVFRPLWAHSRSSPTWRSQKGLAFGVKAFTATPLCLKISESARVSQAA